MNAEGRIENDTMVNAIVTYLYDHARAGQVPPVSGKGDPTRGAKLLSDRGCYGCHLVDPNAQRDLTGTYRQFGPNLSGVGSKASRDWIFHWISNPKEWNPDTKMPNLRLSPEDALDIAEYLSTLKAPPAFETAELPKTDEKVLDRIALYFQMSTKTMFDAKAELAKMDLHGREDYVGKNLIAHYGCYACHAIPGFEDAKPIGTELTEEGVQGRSPARLRFRPPRAHAPGLVPHQAARAAHLRPRPRARLGGEAADAQLPLLRAGAGPGADRPPGLPAAQRGGERRQGAQSPRGRHRARPPHREGPQLPGLATSSRASAARSARSSPTRRSHLPSSRARARRCRATGSSPSCARRRPARSARGSRSTCRRSASTTRSSTTSRSTSRRWTSPRIPSSCRTT